MNNPSHSGIVQCEQHGQVAAAYICAHLVDQLASRNYSGIGFFEPDLDRRESTDRHAWCGQCEKMREAEGEWNDRSEKFAQIKLVCAQCFEKLKVIQRGFAANEA